MTMDQYHEIIGTGWAFPLRADGRGGIAMSRGDTDIEQAIRIILGTAKGERRMRPEFGCGIHDLVFASNDEATWGMARYYVQDALEMWEPRIDIEAIEATPNPDHDSRLDISVKYRVRATKDARTLVYPFYLVHLEEEA
jgi:phage baseplate assembly protein W